MSGPRGKDPLGPIGEKGRRAPKPSCLKYNCGGSGSGPQGKDPLGPLGEKGATAPKPTCLKQNWR